MTLKDILKLIRPDDRIVVEEISDDDGDVSYAWLIRNYYERKELRNVFDRTVTQIRGDHHDLIISIRDH